MTKLGILLKVLYRQVTNQVILSMATMRTVVAGQELVSNIPSIEYSNVVLYVVWGLAGCCTSKFDLVEQKEI